MKAWMLLLLIPILGITFDETSSKYLLVDIEDQEETAVGKSRLHARDLGNF